MEPLEHVHLYDVSIDTLELSDDAVIAIKRTGIETVGDCIDHFLRGNDAMINVRGRMLVYMNNEVKPALVEHGYGRYFEEMND